MSLNSQCRYIGKNAHFLSISQKKSQNETSSLKFAKKRFFMNGQNFLGILTSVGRCQQHDHDLYAV